MNRQLIIGAIVGGIILFIWQFMAWMMLHLHDSKTKYSQNQDEILALLTEKLGGEGEYFLPTSPPGASEEEYMKNIEASMGKPWATIQYRSVMKDNMTMCMIRGFAVDLVVVAMFIWLLSQFSNRNKRIIFISSVLVGLISYLSTTYADSIWFESNTISDLIDGVVGWSLVGIWLGYWMGE